jgi:APA family basic amino acid/polyamine antiporter
MTNSSKKYTARSATALIVANMIGTGVFASLGLQLLEIQSGFVILMLWAVGGLTALCGALSYAELGAAMPQSGGEYNFLSKIYHPMVGFVTGWVSTTIGFAAPVAVVAILFAGYFTSVFPIIDDRILAVGLIVVLTAIHITNHKNSGGFHQIMTLFKLLLIIGFSGLAYFMVDTPQEISFVPTFQDVDVVFSGSFAVTLIFVNYSYMGWNSATYISSELDNPQKNLPKILLTGTLTVAVLYVILNFIFLYVAPIEELVGVKEVGYVAAKHVFGQQGTAIMSISLSVVLISTVSAMTMAGPRAFQAIGQDYPVFKFMAKTNQHNIPVFAILLQSTLSIFFVLTSSFAFILVFAGFTLGLSNFATVLGVIVLRKTQPNLKRPYKTWLYPLTPIVYLCLMGWTLVYIIKDKPQEAFMSLVVILLGIVMYYISKLLDNSLATKH